MNITLKEIINELKDHSPFTVAGAVSGIVLMLIFRNFGHDINHGLFLVFHPGHVVLSAMVTTSMFRLHTVRKNLLLIIAIGYFGSVGIATLSDIMLPHLGLDVFGLNVPVHGNVHENDEDGSAEHDCHNDNKLHFSFIEEWYLVNPAAVIGILIAFFRPRTKTPHGLHVLISTWASASYILMTAKSTFSAWAMLGVFIILFVSVWLPCCVSDIIFPMLFAKKRIEHN